MAGALLTDLNRLELVSRRRRSRPPRDAVLVAAAAPRRWDAAGGLHRRAAGGEGDRRAVFALLFVGAASHYLLDIPLYKRSGVTSPLLWPFVTHGFAVDGFYLSSDRWRAAVVTVVAGVLCVVDRQLMRTKRSTLD